MSIIYDLLIKEENSLLEKLEKVRVEIENYKTSQNISIQKIASDISYPIKRDFIDADDVKKYSAPQKILLALKDNNRFMKIREIAEYICNITDENVDELKTQLSRRTKYLKEKGKITKYQYGTRLQDTFWGSPNWLDNNGNIKKGYAFNDDTINSAQIKLIDL